MRATSGLVVAPLLWSATALAQQAPLPAGPVEPSTTPVEAPSLSESAEEERFARELERAPPPPSHVVYFQYGVAFTGNQILSAGPICSDLAKPCVLGSGGGVVIRGGWRSSGPLYIGGAYELTKQDPDKLYRIALLQQARAEVRYYIPTHRTAEPYAAGSLGVIGYGNEWAVDTFGPSGSIGAGIEYQITQTTVVGVGLDYRLAYFTAFTDTAGSSRDAGIGQLLGFNILLEQRSPVVTAGPDSK